MKFSTLRLSDPIIESEQNYIRLMKLDEVLKSDIRSCQYNQLGHDFINAVTSLKEDEGNLRILYRLTYLTYINQYPQRVDKDSVEYNLDFFITAKKHFE